MNAQAEVAELRMDVSLIRKVLDELIIGMKPHESLYLYSIRARRIFQDADKLKASTERSDG